MNKTFVTIFDRAKNFHLVKDVGQIPFHMHKEFNYDSKIVTIKNDKKYSYLDDEVDGLKIDFISRVKILKINLGVIIYLIKNAKKIDILHQFHIRNYTLLYAKIYKIFNKNGINYIKADANEKVLINNKNIFKKKYLKIIEKYIDLISFETKELTSLVKEKYPLLENKFFYITNGVDDNYIKNLSLDDFDYSKKENIILYVARIGTYQKNTELFLNSLANIDLKDWKVHIIGEIEKEFELFINKYFDKNKNLKDKLIFKGSISNREEIYEYYSKSKVFCLSSRYEGFPLVFPEAIYFGNYIITTDVSGAKDITDNEKYGTIVKDFSEDNYSLAIEELINSNTLNSKLCNEIRTFSKNNYTWKNIVKNLEEALNRRIGL